MIVLFRRERGGPKPPKGAEARLAEELALAEQQKQGLPTDIEPGELEVKPEDRIEWKEPGAAETEEEQRAWEKEEGLPTDIKPGELEVSPEDKLDWKEPEAGEEEDDTTKPGES